MTSQFFTNYKTHFFLCFFKTSSLEKVAILNQSHVIDISQKPARIRSVWLILS